MYKLCEIFVLKILHRKVVNRKQRKVSAMWGAGCKGGGRQLPPGGGFLCCLIGQFNKVSEVIQCDLRWWQDAELGRSLESSPDGV